MIAQAISTRNASRTRMTRQERAAEATSACSGVGGFIFADMGDLSVPALVTLRLTVAALTERAGRRGNRHRRSRGRRLRSGEAPDVDDARQRRDVRGDGENPKRPERAPDQEADRKQDDALRPRYQPDRRLEAGRFRPSAGVADQERADDGDEDEERAEPV